MMRRVIVTRHPAAVELIHRELPQFRGAPVLPVAREEDVAGAVVAGNLPLRLAALASLVLAIEFTGDPPRGRDYTLAEMDEAGAYISAYQVVDSSLP